MEKIRIGNVWIGETEPPYFIADIGANHDGDIGRALQLIEMAKEAGAHAAKFQNFRAQSIVSGRGFEEMGPGLGHQATWKKPVFEVYREASLPFEWTPLLKEKCRQVGIEFLTTPYDPQCADHVDPFVAAFKIGSGDITWPVIIEHIARKRKPVLLATGAASLDEVERAVALLRRHIDSIVLMQCNTNYSGDLENIGFANLNVLATYASRFPGLVLGLSDHTPGPATVCGAVALGARVIEKHFTDDNTRQGPDHKFAMTPRAWREMVQLASQVHQAMGDGVKRVERNEEQTVLVQRRCLRFTRDVARGETIKESDLISLRPAPRDGVSPWDLPSVLGKRLQVDRAAGTHLRAEDLQTSCAE